ncbi:MAG: pilus assembly protein [Defluviitaleaceae bacterium]|nr:pilus assembly protein [Defluviitaleaceae bacterium]
MKKKLKRDENGFALVEMAIYFPLILLAFLGFIFGSMFLTQRVLLDRAVARATTEAAAWLSGDIMRFGRFSDTPDTPNFGQQQAVSIRTNPYVGLFNRFYPMDVDSFDTRIQELVLEYARLAVGGNIQVDVEHNWYFMVSDIHVTATQTLVLPINLNMIDVDWQGIQLRSSSTARVFRTGQVVNNINFGFDAIRRNMHPPDLQSLMEDLPGTISNIYSITNNLFIP